MLLSTLWRCRNRTPRRLVDSLAFLDRETLETYLAQETEHFSAQKLDDFRKDAFVFRKRQTGLLLEEKARDYNLDRAALVLTLEGQHEYERLFVSNGPINPRTNERYSIYSSEYIEWAASQDRTVLTSEQAYAVEQIEYGVRVHPEARKLLFDGVAQGVIRCDYQGLSCQSRPDWISPSQGLVGLVICDSFGWSDSSLRNNGVVHRLAFEHAMIRQVAEVDLPVHVIAVEKRAPYRCGVWLVSRRLLRKARKENEAAMSRFKQCCQSGHWPSCYEAVRVLTPISF